MAPVPSSGIVKRLLIVLALVAVGLLGIVALAWPDSGTSFDDAAVRAEISRQIEAGTLPADVDVTSLIEAVRKICGHDPGLFMPEFPATESGVERLVDAGCH